MPPQASGRAQTIRGRLLMASPVMVLVFVHVSGWRHRGQRPRIAAMAAVLASMMRSIPQRASVRGDRSEHDWNGRDLAAFARGGDVVRGTAATLFHATMHRGSTAPKRSLSCVSVALLFRVFHARLALANSPSGRTPVSQDAASAYEIALGIASGSLPSDAVARVT
jgi:hypothetical protein